MHEGHAQHRAIGDQIESVDSVVVGSLLVIDAAYASVGAFTVTGLIVTATVVLGVRVYRRSRVAPGVPVAEANT